MSKANWKKYIGDIDPIIFYEKMDKRGYRRKSDMINKAIYDSAKLTENSDEFEKIQYELVKYMEIKLEGLGYNDESKLYFKMGVKCPKCSHIMKTKSKKATITCSACNYKIPKKAYFDIKYENPKELPILFRLNGDSFLKGDCGVVDRDNYEKLYEHIKEQEFISFSEIHIGKYDLIPYSEMMNFILRDFIPIFRSKNPAEILIAETENGKTEFYDLDTSDHSLFDLLVFYHNPNAHSDEDISYNIYQLSGTLFEGGLEELSQLEVFKEFFKGK